MGAGGVALAYSSWGPWLSQDPLVNMLLGAGAALLVAFLFALSLEVPLVLRRGLAAALLLVHLLYVVRYASAYSLQLSVAPLLDVFRDHEGRVSAVVDVGQLMLLYLAASLALERRRKHITPAPAGGSPYGATAGS
jgi:hypothetical protein